MYNCNCRKHCYMMPKCDNKIIETACSDCGTVAQYYEPSREESCKCGFDNEASVFPSNPMYGQSYVPIQYMDKTFTPCVGLKMGTIFPELVSPYSPCQSIEENAFIAAMNTIGEGCNKC